MLVHRKFFIRCELNTGLWLISLKSKESKFPVKYKNWFELMLVFAFRALNSKIAKGLRDQDKIAYHMKKDASVCCPSKTTAPRRKRKVSSTDEEDDTWSEPSDDDESTNRSKKEVKTNETAKTDLRKEVNQEACRSAVSDSDTRNKVINTFDVQSISQCF